MLRKLHDLWQRHVKAAAVVSFLLAAGCLLPTVNALADDLANKKSQLDTINGKIENQRKIIQEYQDKADSVTGKISAIQKQVDETQSELDTLNADITQHEADIKTEEETLVTLEDEIEKDQKILGDRLCFIYQEGDGSYLDVLLTSESLPDMLNRVVYLNAIVDNDQELIETTHELVAQAEEKRQTLETEKTELEAQKKEQEAKKKTLDEQKAEQQKVLDEINSEKAPYEQALKEMETESSQLETLIKQEEEARKAAAAASSSSSSSSSGSKMTYVSGTGQFMWPSNNSHTITSEFGYRYHPILGYYKLHTGIDIGAAYGTPVLAADTGTVIFSGWQNAYGNCVIISHGNNLTTLYGHMSSLSVSVGQAVTRGTTVGRVGSTGWSTGPHLHFEVRLNGSPVSPHNYL